MTLGWRRVSGPRKLQGKLFALSCPRKRASRASSKTTALDPAFAGVTESQSGCLGELALLDDEGVVEPAGERFDVGRLDRRATPDPQACRRVAISADVERDLFLLK